MVLHVQVMSTNITLPLNGLCTGSTCTEQGRRDLLLQMNLTPSCISEGELESLFCLPAENKATNTTGVSFDEKKNSIFFDGYILIY